jgi:regulator of cell morphogenesis and NO signaling
MKDRFEISEDMTVNEITLAKPEAISVFDRYGIDSCCGGSLPLSEVARRHRLDLAALLQALNENAPTCSSAR